MDPSQLSTLLLQTLHPATQKQGMPLLLSPHALSVAEGRLLAAESDPDLVFKLMGLVYKAEINVAIRLSAVLFLKNYTKKLWPLVAPVSFSAHRLFSFIG